MAERAGASLRREGFAREPEGEFRPGGSSARNAAGGGDKRRLATEILLAITDLIVDGRELPELFEELAPLLRELTNCKLVVFAFCDGGNNSGVSEFWESGSKTTSAALAVEESPTAWVCEHQQPLLIPDLELDTDYAQTLAQIRAGGVRSYSVVPLATARRLYGALGIGRGEAGALSDEELRLLERAASPVALAVENHEIHREWKQQQNRLQSLMAISRELASTLESDQLVPLVFAKMREITNYDYAGVALLGPDGRFFRVNAIDTGKSADMRAREGERIALSEALSTRAIETRSVTFHSADEVDHPNPVVKKLFEDGIRRVCCVPLLMGNRALGSIVLGSRQKTAFRGDGEYLQQFGVLIAVAIHNASTHREVERAEDQLTQEKEYLEQEIRGEQVVGGIIGKSLVLKHVLDYAAIVADTDATVLITGETGTGKERVARSIHLMSSRRDRNFIKLNCAAIPTGLLESELFGHEKGAFTGAVSQKVGRLELADRGTLLLDEIGEIPLELQPKLLRVLQDQEFERLGGNKTIRVDARVIAASNKDLARAVEEKEFRNDLFYRLNVFPLHLPPLRERREDIPLLIRHFVERCARRMNKQIDLIPDEAVEAMMNWRWPGNIRELENFIERSVILSAGNRLRPPLAELREEMVARRPPDLERTLRDRERDHILEVLRQTRGLLSGAKGAAARLGLKRTTLQYKMQKLGIARSEYLD